MNRLYRRIAFFALFFYLGSTSYIRFDEFDKVGDIFMRSFYSLPWDAFPLRYIAENEESISTQMGILSSRELVQLLETNPELFPHMHNGITLNSSDIKKSQGDHLVIRFKYRGNCYFDIKYYIPCFPYSINLNDLHLLNSGIYHTIIMPNPIFLKKQCEKPEDISMRWKFFW